jgi:hypothetical protein
VVILLCIDEEERSLKQISNLIILLCIDEEEKSLKQMSNLIIFLCIDEVEKSLKQIPNLVIFLALTNKGRVETRCQFWSFCSASMKKRRVETDTHLGHFACIDEEGKS